MLKNIPFFEGMKLDAIIRGVLWALALTLLLSLLLSLLLHLTSLSENLVSGFSRFVFLLSVMGGAAIGTWSAGHKGLQHGLAIALGYWLITLLIGLLWTSESFGLWLITKRLLYAIATGALGGIIGIGLSNK